MFSEMFAKVLRDELSKRGYNFDGVWAYKGHTAENLIEPFVLVRRSVKLWMLLAKVASEEHEKDCLLRGGFPDFLKEVPGWYFLVRGVRGGNGGISGGGPYSTEVHAQNACARAASYNREFDIKQANSKPVFFVSLRAAAQACSLTKRLRGESLVKLKGNDLDWRWRLNWLPVGGVWDRSGSEICRVRSIKGERQGWALVYQNQNYEQSVASPVFSSFSLANTYSERISAVFSRNRREDGSIHQHFYKISPEEWEWDVPETTSIERGPNILPIIINGEKKYGLAYGSEFEIKKLKSFFTIDQAEAWWEQLKIELGLESSPLIFSGEDQVQFEPGIMEDDEEEFSSREFKKMLEDPNYLWDNPEVMGHEIPGLNSKNDYWDNPGYFED